MTVFWVTQIWNPEGCSHGLADKVHGLLLFKEVGRILRLGEWYYFGIHGFGGVG
jgi:hypothetical protein